jgi:plastocyanin
MGFSRIAGGGAAVLALFLCAISSPAQQNVTIHVDVVKAANQAKKVAGDFQNVAVWLDPVDSPAAALVTSTKAAAAIVQKDKMFEPHVTVVRRGSYISFPNQDPFFHNVFSLYNGKRFDLGLYEAGTSKSIRFDRPGVSYLFCNIHEDMSAIVLAVDTPYYGISDHTGKIEISGVPDGRYTLHVFYERSTAEQLKSLDREVTISPATRTIAEIHVVASPDVTLAHKNKYGEDYVPPPASGYGP